MGMSQFYGAGDDDELNRTIQSVGRRPSTFDTRICTARSRMRNSLDELSPVVVRGVSEQSGTTGDRRRDTASKAPGVSVAACDAVTTDDSASTLTLYYQHRVGRRCDRGDLGAINRSWTPEGPAPWAFGSVRQHHWARRVHRTSAQSKYRSGPTPRWCARYLSPSRIGFVASAHSVVDS